MQPRAGNVQTMKRAVLVLVAVGALGAGNADTRDVSGTYDAQDRTVHILAGQDELYVSYADQFGNDHSCTCLARAHADGAGRYRFDDASGLGGTVSIDDKQIKFNVSGQPDCCGSGWPGLPTFDLAGRGAPTACKVKAARAHFYSEAGNQKRPAYVMKGDPADVAPAPGELEPRFYLARFAGPKKSTMCLINRDELSCKTKQ